MKVTTLFTTNTKNNMNMMMCRCMQMCVYGLFSCMQRS